MIHSRTSFPRLRRSLCAVTVAACAAVGLSHPAAADVPPPTGNETDAVNPVRINQDTIAYRYEQDWFGPSTIGAYQMNIITPYPGNEVRCWRFHGANFECWQADPQGEFHQLQGIAVATTNPSAWIYGNPYRTMFAFPGVYTGVAATDEFWQAAVGKGPGPDFFPSLTRWVLDPRNVEAVNTYAPLLLPILQGRAMSSDIATSSMSGPRLFQTMSSRR
ncbi:hypothetical protein ACFSSC_07265 [Corynebacterium mendelii]|uniref:Uncharacterized protein n=1 Tax=Corynebacterium mendelii TaxID=2765362 RepID=A0A939IXV5_9CORY|nr:hypothetical protein [Corynebacterium mendelii]MBN9644870.1 hypothetical protein [Corynebacterium mendelii]